jgi:acyl-CoA reductase-like NAD-dependent aldehyde dehydrogenase
MPTLLDALAPLVLGSPVLSKPAARDPVTPALVAASVAERAPELGTCIGVASVRRDDAEALDAILAVPRVVVTGSDETVAAIEARLTPGTTLVAHGHKLSMAVLGEAADLRDAAARLAVDVSLWDQLGCLSPVACFAVGDGERARAFAAALAEALEARAAELPLGEVDAADAAAIAHERGEAELRAAATGAVVVHASEASTVVAEADATLRPAPLHRFVRVHPIAATADLPRALAPLSPHIAGLAHAGYEVDEGLSLAQATGASRAAPFGELQSPPLAWPRDGLGVFSSLLA